MTAWLFTQYQQKAEPPSSQAIFNPTFESVYHQPWSEPSALKQTIKPVLAIALMASGLFAPVLTQDQITDKYESRWHQPWSQPLYPTINPKLAIALAASGPMAPVLSESEINAKLESRWHQPWSTPLYPTINPKLAIALSASGLIAPVLDPETQITQKFESRWHQGWSTPLYPTINPKLAIALAASGPQAPVLDPETQITQKFESRWHQGWSTPLYPTINPKLAIALAASGPFAPSQFDFISGITPWFAPLAEPVRLPVGIKVYLQPTFTTSQLPVFQAYDHAWYQEFSTPKRFLAGLGAHLQQVNPLQTPVQPVTSRFIQWFAPLNEPVRLPIGLKAWLQQTTAWEPRLLPPVNWTATMAATETNNDVAEFAIYVYNSITPVTTGTSANVSITEVKANNSAAASLRES